MEEKDPEKIILNRQAQHRYLAWRSEKVIFFKLILQHPFQSSPTIHFNFSDDHCDKYLYIRFSPLFLYILV